MQHLNLPRALRGAVRAEETPEQLFMQVKGALGDLRQKHVNDISDVREHVDNLTTAMNAMQGQIDGGIKPSGGSMIAVDADYTKTFASFIRKGDGEGKLSELQGAGDRAAIQAALSVGSDTNGGYLAPVEWDCQISEEQVSTSPMRKLAKVVTTSVGAFSTLWQSGNPGSGWVGETAARPQTSNPTFDPITFAAGEIYANPAATQRILDDAAIDIGAWLVDALRVEFNRQENIAFLSGPGVASNQPAGLLTYVTGGANDGTHPGGNLTVVEEAIAVDALIDFMYGLGAPYRQNATWVMSSLTAAALTRLKDADGNLIWRESLIVGQPATLLGRPVEIDEGMPGPTAGNIAIAFGDFRAGYLVNDRYSSLRLLRDPFTNKPFVHFYATKRVGGGVLDPNAIRLLRIPV